MKYVWGESEHHKIQTIVQRKPPIDSLKCSYLAEVLDLSKDKKSYLYQFDLKEGTKKLLDIYVIKEANIRKLKPSTLFVEYELRKPIAYLGNHSNTFIDEEGMLIPIFPFYTPKRLPEVFLEGDCDYILGKKIEKEQLTLITEFLTLFPSHSVKSLDLSKVDMPTLGQREVVVVLENEQILRLTKERYREEIEEFFLMLSKKVVKNNQMIDFRVPSVAIIGDINGIHSNTMDMCEHRGS